MHTFLDSNRQFVDQSGGDQIAKLPRRRRGGYRQLLVSERPAMSKAVHQFVLPEYDKYLFFIIRLYDLTSDAIVFSHCIVSLVSLVAL
jgi:hypothetical protein